MWQTTTAQQQTHEWIRRPDDCKSRSNNDLFISLKQPLLSIIYIMRMMWAVCRSALQVSGVRPLLGGLTPFAHGWTARLDGVVIQNAASSQFHGARPPIGQSYAECGVRLPVCSDPVRSGCYRHATSPRIERNSCTAGGKPCRIWLRSKITSRNRLRSPGDGVPERTSASASASLAASSRPSACCS